MCVSTHSLTYNCIAHRRRQRKYTSSDVHLTYTQTSDVRIKKDEPALGLRDAVEDLEVALAAVVAGEELALEETSVVDARVLVAAQRSALRVAHVLNAAHDCAENTTSISEQNYLIDCAENTPYTNEHNYLIDCAENTPSISEQNYLIDCAENTSSISEQNYLPDCRKHPIHR